MPLQKAPRGQSYRHRRKNDADQRRDIQKFFRALQRRANFRTRIADAFDALARLQLRDNPIAVRINRFGAAGNLQSITDAAAGLHQTGGRKVGCVHHHARSGVDKTDGRIRLLRHDGGYI